MKESYREGTANHSDPESCVRRRKKPGEALTGAQAGWVWSSEKRFVRGADAVKPCGRQHRVGRHGKSCSDPAESQTPSMSGNSMHENRETPSLPSTNRNRAGEGTR